MLSTPLFYASLPREPTLLPPSQSLSVPLSLLMSPPSLPSVSAVPCCLLPCSHTPYQHHTVTLRPSQFPMALSLLTCTPALQHSLPLLCTLPNAFLPMFQPFALPLFPTPSSTALSPYMLACRLCSDASYFGLLCTPLLQRPACLTNPTLLR
jgi:hypothetical protein